MMDHPFTIGGRYQNRNGSYKVLSLADDQMTILYENGRVHTANIRLQARIWENIEMEENAAERKPTRVDKEEEGLDSWPIKELVQEVLQTRFEAPHPTDIIDQVCLAIENNPEWHRRYKALVQHFSSQGKYGKLTVNSSIGWFTKDLTGMVTLKAGNLAKSTLIESYSTLGYAKNA
ncbi:MAG: hypothetical protein R6X32_18660 [Chloroflexota bacterium]